MLEKLRAAGRPLGPKELLCETGWKGHKKIQAIGEVLIAAGLVIIEGSGNSRRYRLVSSEESAQAG